MSLKKISRAIISVSNKSNLKILLPILKKFKIDIISSGGTYKKIRNLKYTCSEVSNYTNSSEMLEGRVKTLHPKIHAGILNVRKNKKHINDIKKNNIKNIDLVVVDLYPFENYVSKKIKFEKLIEYIDIGGNTLIRAAAKNFNDVVVISDIKDYFNLVSEMKRYGGSTSIKFRKLMSAKAFSLTAYYDSVISNHLNSELKIKFPSKKTIHGNLFQKLRYGENPHQESVIYSAFTNLGLNKIHGKDLSYNNYNDIFSALEILKTLKKNSGTVIIKHANPCGVSEEKNNFISYKNALACDPISAFGGIVAINSIINKKVAIELNKNFFEVIVAKGFHKDALKILKRKKNLRLIDYSNLQLNSTNHLLFFDKGFISQDTNTILINKKLKFITKKKPSKKQLSDLKFAFNICKFTKSNAIVLAKNKSTIGIGSGQPSRLDSCKIASNKAIQFVPEKLEGSVAASDGFFPFPDGIEQLIETGVSAIIQPGGSINDKEIIEIANRSGITMIFTGTRHFKH